METAIRKAIALECWRALVLRVTFPRKLKPSQAQTLWNPVHQMLYFKSYIFRNQGFSSEPKMTTNTNKQTNCKRTKPLFTDPDPQNLYTTNFRSKYYQALASKTQYNDKNNHVAYKIPKASQSLSNNTVFWYLKGFLSLLFLLSFFVII